MCLAVSEIRWTMMYRSASGVPVSPSGRANPVSQSLEARTSSVRAGWTGVFVEQLGQGLLESTPHLQLGIVIRAGPSAGLAEEHDVDAECLRPADVANQAGDAHRRRARQRRLDRVRRGRTRTLRVDGQAHVPQGLDERGTLVERVREIGAGAEVDVGHAASIRRGRYPDAPTCPLLAQAATSPRQPRRYGP